MTKLQDATNTYETALMDIPQEEVAAVEAAFDEWLAAEGDVVELTLRGISDVLGCPYSGGVRPVAFMGFLAGYRARG